MDLTEAEDHFVLKADLPGPDRGGRLDRGPATARSRSPASARPSTCSARRAGTGSSARSARFSRALTLPDGVDPDAVSGRVRPRRAHRADPEARGAQAAPDRDRRGGQRQRPAGRGGNRRGEVAASPGRHALPGASRPSTIDARDGSARAGVLRLAHGEVQHAGFVPLASNARCGGSPAAEVEALGFDMVLGNTFHLFIEPGHELHRARWAACTSSWAGGGRSSPTRAASRSSRWATARWPRRSSAAAAQTPEPRSSRSTRRASPSAPTRRRRALHGAGDLDGGAGGARLGHRARLRRVHALPRRPRLHRALDGAHPPLARPLHRLARRARARRGRRCSGSCRAASTRTCAAESAAYVAARAARRDRDRRLARAGEGADARGGGLVARRRCPTSARATCWASATWTTSSTPWAPASTLFDCATPTRLARHGTALVPDPERRWRLDLTKSRSRGIARADRRATAPARPAASTPAATSTTWRAGAS